VNTTPASAGSPGAVPSRRVLLRAAGLTILTGFGVAELAGQSPAAARTLARSSDQDEQPMYYIHDGRNAIALTIDDGPSPIYTPQIVRLPHRYRVTAAFSMIGVNVEAHPGVAREVVEAGHMIVNHTWTHPDLAYLSPVTVYDEMAYGTDAIHRVTGRTPHMFRAPYGAWSPTVLQYCEQMRMTPLDWSVDPRDWSLPGVAAIVDNIMDNTRTGSIILEHDGGGDRSQTVAALRIVLPRLLAEGFHFRTP
jgi:peptidoglycan-N-acetylglucosamine deacetylase